MQNIESRRQTKVEINSTQRASKLVSSLEEVLSRTSHISFEPKKRKALIEYVEKKIEKGDSEGRIIGSLLSQAFKFSKKKVDSILDEMRNPISDRIE